MVVTQDYGVAALALGKKAYAISKESIDAMVEDGILTAKGIPFKVKTSDNEKSAMGSIMKNAALVGTMFIPYVGPWIAGLSVAS